MARRKIDATEVFEEIASEPQTSTVLEKLVAKAAALAREIEAAQAHIDALSLEFRDITERKLPEQMMVTNTKRKESSDGTIIELKDFIGGAIPKDPKRQEEAFAWLKKNGGGDLIRLQVAFALDPNDAKGKKLIADFAKKSKLLYTAAEKVHPQSLYALIREKLENGRKVPVDKLGLHVGKVAKITLPAGKVKNSRKKKNVQ